MMSDYQHMDIARFYKSVPNIQLFSFSDLTSLSGKSAIEGFHARTG